MIGARRRGSGLRPGGGRVVGGARVGDSALDRGGAGQMTSVLGSALAASSSQARSDDGEAMLEDFR